MPRCESVVDRGILCTAVPQPPWTADRLPVRRTQTGPGPQHTAPTTTRCGPETVRGPTCPQKRLIALLVWLLTAAVPTAQAQSPLPDPLTPRVGGPVYSLATQGNGKILVGGWFSLLGGQGRDSLGRLNNTEPATQSLGYDGSKITWLRGGASPEVWRTTPLRTRLTVPLGPASAPARASLGASN
jgi:hypothetical protein